MWKCTRTSLNLARYKHREALPGPGDTGTPVLPPPPSATALTRRGQGASSRQVTTAKRPTRPPVPLKNQLGPAWSSTHTQLHENSLRMEPELLLELSCAFFLSFAFVFVSWKLLFWLCLRAAGKLLELVWQFSQSFVEKGESTHTHTKMHWHSSCINSVNCCQTKRQFS